MNDGEHQERHWIAAFALCAALSLSSCAPVPDPSATLTPEQSISLIDQARATDVTLESIAETLALGTRATEIQRENLTAEVVGRRVTWDIPVYEVSLEEGWYSVMSQAIPIQDVQAVPLVRVFASVVARDKSDTERLEKLKTDDVIRVTGIVQEIRLRTIVVLGPAVIDRETQP